MSFQTKMIQKINNLLAYLLICQTFFYQILEKNQFAKPSLYQTFPLYGKYIADNSQHIINYALVTNLDYGLIHMHYY